MEVQVKEVSVQTEKGYALAANFFYTADHSSQILVISSATGVLQKYYSKFATYFAGIGFRVYTFDYSGIGQSGSETNLLKQNTTSLSEWGSNDQAAMLAYAKQQNPNTQLTLITHSVGGQLVGFNVNYRLIDKLVMVGSQTGYWNYFKGIHLPKMLLFWYLIIPVLTPIFGYFPSRKLGLFENLPESMVYEWQQWGKKKDYLMHFYNKETYFFDHLKTPMLAYSFEFDTFAPKAAVDWLVKQYKNVTLERIHYIPEKGMKKVKHFGFFKEKFKDPFWTQTSQWILNN